MMKRIASLVAAHFRRPSLEDAMEREFQFHLEARTEEILAREPHLSHAEAYRQAKIDFGSAEHFREECRASLGYRLWDQVRLDLRYATRVLRANRGFTLTAISILALAIGVNTCFFSILNQFVLKPLPIPGVERNYWINAVQQNGRVANNWSLEEYTVLAENASAVARGIYADSTVQIPIVTPQAMHAFVTLASRNYFTALGASPRIGRTFPLASGDPVVVLSDSGWRRIFARDPNALGRSITMRGRAFTVIGIMEPSFSGAAIVVPDFWLPYEFNAPVRPSASANSLDLSILLAPRMVPAQAIARLNGIATAFPRPAEEKIVRLELEARQSAVPTGPMEKAVAVMIFLVFLLLIWIACTNLAALQLSRAASRKVEIGMRLALGASRSRIVSQLLTESILLSLLGAVAGLLLASLSLHWIYGYLFSEATRIGIVVVPISLDWRVFLFSSFLGVLAGLAFGLLPALESTAGTLTLRRGPHPFRTALLGGQTAASFALLLLSALLVSNAQRLQDLRPGFDLETLVDLGVNEPLSAADLLRLRRFPEVLSASAVDSTPLNGWTGRTQVSLEGVTQNLRSNQVDESYFATMQLRPLAGRLLRADERGAALLSASTAKLLWPQSSAPYEQVLGQSLQLGSGEETKLVQVVGVVPDVSTSWIWEEKDPHMLYLPHTGPVQRVILRAAPASPALLEQLKAFCLEASVPTYCQPRSFRDLASFQRFPFTAAALISSSLGLLGLLLTCIGLFGTVSYSVVQRTREIGVHMALGALPRQVILRLVLEGLRGVFVGIAVGLPVCLLLSGLVASSIVGIRVFDAFAYTLVPGLLLAVGAFSCYWPARRAARLNPATALRVDS